MNRFFLGAWLALACAGLVGCKKNAGAAAADGSADATDGSVEAMAAACPAVDGAPEPDAGTVPGIDEFGPNAPASKTISSLGRVNIFEVTKASLLERLDIYLQADMPHTRLTIAIQESTSRTAAFTKLTDVQLDFGVCQGWATSGPLAIPLRVGRFYAMGFDPNQVVTPFVSTDGESLPTDGMFGRLIGSRTATSVSVPTLTWEKFMDKEYNRQRVVTSPREPDEMDVAPVVDAGADGASDANRDALTDTATDAVDSNRDVTIDAADASGDTVPADAAATDAGATDAIVDGPKG